MRLTKNKKYSIDKKTADATLQNVFAACEQDPNETPLEVIRVVGIANEAAVKAGLAISVVLLALVLMAPLAFI